MLKRTELASRGRYEILCLVGWVLAVRLIWSAWVVVTGSIDLWSGGTQLRGANLWQRIVVPDLDGPEFLGDGTVGPPVHQADLDWLVALGVNLAVLSHPGPFTERPPYRLDEQIQANLDRLIDMADPAGLIVVTALRTGLRQSDFTFYRDGAGDGFDPELLIEDVWTSLSTQSGWCEMWQHAAARYRDHPAVVGYELMVEPNGARVVHEIWDQDDFYPRHAGSLTDWNAFCPRIVVAVRWVDPTTPVLIGSMGWNSVEWLPYLETIDDPRIAYTVHQYEPQPQYTHQEPGGTHRYPGWFDLDWDGRPDRFDRTWLARRLQTVVELRQSHGVPVAVTEFGLKRWVPDAGTFMTDQMALFEELGLGYALWALYPDWPPIVDIDDFDFIYGTDPGNRSDAESDLLGAIRDAWSHNLLRSADE